MKKTMFAPFLLILALTSAPATSHADAAGYDFWGEFEAEIFGLTILIPSGELLHVIEGDGLYVTQQGGSFLVAGNLCEPSLRLTYANGDYLNSEVKSGCMATTAWKLRINSNRPRGDTCAELWIKNWRRMIAKQCHYIHD